MKKGLVFGLVLLMVVSMVSMASAEKAVKEWTFMVFLNADNNLDSFGVKDLNEMEKVGSTDDINIVALVDRERGPANIYYVTKDNSSSINSKIVKPMGEMDMGDYKEMVKFVKYCKENYPAKRYVLDVWNHGAGWKNKHEVFKGLSYDDSSNNHMTTPQVGEGLKQIEKVLGQKLDIFANDACLMGMLELSAQIKDYCKFFVASEETEPGDGYTYDLFLKPLAKNPKMSAKDLAVKMAEAYIEHYQTTSSSATQSAVDQSKVDALIAKTEALGVAMKKSNDKAAIKSAHTAAQKFYYRDNVDLLHFAELLASKTSDSAVKAAAKAVIKAGNDAIAYGGTCGYKTKNAKGIAIYMPKYSMSSAYKTIALGKTKWVDGIAAVISAFKSTKEAKVANNMDYNMNYPTIAAQAIQLEMERGNFKNFETLLNMGDTDTLSILKKKVGADLLRGNNPQLKTQFNRMIEIK